MPNTAVSTPPPERRRRRRFAEAALAALVGVFAAVVALATAELVAGLVEGRSPVVSVGEVVIDNVPPGVKDLAIDLFGTADKVALVVGILVLLLLVACAIGLVARRRPAVGLAGIALFGVVGIAATLDDPLAPSGAAAVAPGLLGALAGMGALAFALRLPGAPSPEPADAAGGRHVDRRAFLGMTGLLGAAAVGVGGAGRWLQARSNAKASRASVVLADAGRPLPALPDAVEVGVRGVTPFTTPNGDFYRIDTALVAPQVRAEEWSLRVFGMVDNELELSYDDLMGRDLVEADITMSCVSNEVGGKLVGNARWLGYPLADLLEEAGVQRGATQVVPRSIDGYEAGFPTETALDGRMALVAVGMNGEPLPIDHGFPARLVVPGLYGYVSATKWLTEIELTTLEGFDSYWARPQRGWAKLAPVKTQCRIDTPRGLARVKAGTVPVAGVAWAQTRGIRRVEVQVDDGPWEAAELAGEASKDTWRQWVYRWEATPGLHRLRARATDGTGETQPEERTPPIPDGAQGWPSKPVTVEAASSD